MGGPGQSIYVTCSLKGLQNGPYISLGWEERQIRARRGGVKEGGKAGGWGEGRPSSLKQIWEGGVKAFLGRGWLLGPLKFYGPPYYVERVLDRRG